MNPTSNQKVQTILSSSNANFMQGIFNQASTNTISPAATASASALANNLMPFEIPGIRPGIPLIGLVVTCAWLGLFVIFVGLGTVGRYQFREQYHRNIKREQASGFKTI